MECKGWVDQLSGRSSLLSLGIPLRSPAGLSLQIPTSPTKATNTSTDEIASSFALECTKSLTEMPKGPSSGPLLQEIHAQGKEIHQLATQRDKLRVKLSLLLDRLKPLKAAAHSAMRKGQTIEQLQESILASKYEVASLRHQLGLYQSASKEICKALEKGQLSQENRVHVLNCIRNATKDTYTLPSSRSSPILALDDPDHIDLFFSNGQRRETKGKLSRLKSPYRAPPASLLTLNRQYKGSTKRLKSPRSLLPSTRSLNPSPQPLDQHLQALHLRLKATLEDWQQAYRRKLAS